MLSSCVPAVGSPRHVDLKFMCPYLLSASLFLKTFTDLSEALKAPSFAVGISILVGPSIVVDDDSMCTLGNRALSLVGCTQSHIQMDEMI